MKKRFITLALIFIFLLSSLPINALAETEDTEGVCIWDSIRNFNIIYAHNRAIFDSRQSCENALEFFRRPQPGWLSTSEVDMNRNQHRTPEVISLAEQLTYGLECDLEKARAICNWVARNIRGDMHAPYRYASGVLRTRRAYCAGYASLAAALLRVVNIPVKYISGAALHTMTDPRWPNPMLHDWIEFFADDRWIIADPTWNEFDISVEHLSRTRAIYMDRSGVVFEEITFQDGFIIRNNNTIGDVFEVSVDKSTITEIVIPNNIIYIAYMGDARHRNLIPFTNLERLILPEGLIWLDAHFFQESSLSEIYLPDSLEQIGVGAFRNTSLTHVMIPPNIRRIEVDTFANTNLEAIYIPANVNLIGERAFDNAENLTIFGYYDSAAYHHAYRNDFNFVAVESTITFEDGFVIYNDSIIGSYGLGSEIAIPDSFESIGAFTNSKVEAVYIPPTVTSIDSNAFGSVSVIYGKPDSVAQAFAEERGIAFVVAYDLREPMAVPEVIDVDETIIYVSINEEAERNASTLMVIIVAVAILPLSVVVILIIRKRRND